MGRLWQPVPVRHEIDAWIERFGAERVRQALAPLLTDERIARIEEVLALRLASITAIVEDTYDPHNAAAAIRTAEGLGLCELHVASPRADFLAKGITRGTDRWLDLKVWPRFTEAAWELRERGFQVVATAPDARDDLSTIDVTRPVAVAFGNEHEGLSAEAVAACSGAVRIPMYGFTESYNLSVSVALAVSQLAARRRQVIDAPGDLAPAERDRLRARWYGLRQRGLSEILERSLGPLRG